MPSLTIGKDLVFCHRIPLPNYWHNPTSLQFPFINLLNLSLNGVRGFAYGFVYVTGITVGPLTGASAFLSCLLAAVMSLFPGACILEFATKFPSAGSIYTYTYVTIGEAIAYLFGINIIFDIMCQAAFNCKSASTLLDSWILNATATGETSEFVGMNGSDSFLSFFDHTPDWKAGLFLLAIGIILIFSVTFSSYFFNSLTVIFLVLFFVIFISCFVYGDASNFTSTGGSIFKEGYLGVLKGAAAISFLYIFYDIYSVSAEESDQPQVNVPKAALCGVITLNLIFILTASALAFLIPNFAINPNSAFLDGFRLLNVQWASVLTLVASFIGTIVSSSIAVYVASRYLFAIARDGLLPTCIAYIQPRFKTPLVSTLIVTSVSCILAIFLSTETLVSISQFGCVLLFFIIGLDLLIFRYMPFCAPDYEIRNTLQFRPLVSKILKDNNGSSWIKKPVFFAILLTAGIISVAFAGIVFRESTEKFDPVLLYSSASVFSFLAVVIFTFLCIYSPNPVPPDNEGITAPCLPIVPLLSIVISIVLSMDLDAVCWGRFIIISSFGLVMYFIYRLFKLVNEKRKEYESIGESSSTDQENTRLSRGNIRKTL